MMTLIPYLLTLLLCACGQTGPLYLPSSPAPIQLEKQQSKAKTPPSPTPFSQSQSQ
jgi:predicted small lipoprotein YifL